MNIPSARLTRSGRLGVVLWAVCSRSGCGERFGYADPWPSEGENLWRLMLQPGWMQQPNGVWAMSKRVRSRLSEGRPPAYRRDAPRKLWRGKTDEQAIAEGLIWASEAPVRGVMPTQKRAWISEGHPVLVACPAGHGLQQVALDLVNKAPKRD